METAEIMSAPELGMVYFTLTVFVLLCFVITLLGWRALRKGRRRRRTRRDR
jgi:hypothetical protein